MKRAVAIVLLTIHFFNLGGYLLLQMYALYQSDKFMNELISRNLYNPNSLIEIKIKQDKPIATDWTDFKNINGQIQLKETCYNYVKLKYAKDTLYVKCVPNYEKTKLIQSNIIYAKQVNDTPQDGKDNNSLLKKGGADSKYDHDTAEFSFLCFSNLPPLVIKPRCLAIPSPFIAVQGRPPALLG
ncbi:hypothetical protein A0256_04710 [Mucilaginibacter sp. PAMC 26640]|nr:hypothetical protein A0256_04710 [Mucilaginibacter sp. PAMC 26640]